MCRFRTSVIVALAALAALFLQSTAHAEPAHHDGVWRGEGRVECEAAPASPLVTTFVVRDGTVSGEANGSFRNVPFAMALSGTVTENGVVAAQGAATSGVSFILKFRGRLTQGTLPLVGRPVHAKKGCIGSLDITLVERRDPSPGPSAEERLAKIQTLLDSGLITPEEAAAKRRGILDEL